MEHLDEGMVHAWLDDALASDEARDIATHVQSCASCAALVAEARGFMAASTRIVAQLDHVSANVIPVTTVTAHRKQRRRAWWQHPGFAAAAVLGVTTMSWIALRDKPMVVAPAAAPVVAVTTPMAAEPARSAPTQTATPAPPKRRVAAPAQTVAKMSRDKTASATEGSSANVNAAVADRAIGRAEAIAAPMASAPMPLTMRARGVNALAASEREATPTSMVGCYVVSRSRSDDAKSAGPPFAELPSNIQLTDSVVIASGAATTFVAYGRSSIGVTAQSLRWQTISPNVFSLTRNTDPDAPAMRVSLNASTATEYAARRTTCP